MSRQRPRRVVGPAMVVVMAVTAGAPASIIAFDNPPGPGHFEWEPAVSGTNVVLNITLDAASQGVLISQPGSYRQSWALNTTEVSVGATTANFLAYATAMRISKTPQRCAIVST